MGAKWDNLVCGVRDMATSFGNRAATLGAGLPGTKVGGEVSVSGAAVRIADLLWEGRPHARTATTAGRLRLSRGSLSLQLAPCDTTLRRLQARRSRRLRGRTNFPIPASRLVNSSGKTIFVAAPAPSALSVSKR